VPPEQVDRGRFQRAVADGRAALEQGEPGRAATLLRDALAMWRGRPLADLENEPFVREEVLRLDEAWLAAMEARIEADLALGHHDELVPELQALVRAHPLRERLRAQLMLALYRSGRQADALEVYGEGRRMLVDELGLEPGPELQRLQQGILAQAPELAAAARPRLAIRAGRAPLVAALAALAAVAEQTRRSRTAQARPSRST
jgi:DNA-binding SARP family transcriptional activator